MPSIVRLLLPLVLPLILFVPCPAQRLVVSGLDVSGYPVVRARVYMLDSAGRPLPSLSAGDIVVTEDGTRRELLSVSCPPSLPPRAISSVLTIDVSGSMAYAVPGADGVPNIDLAASAARAWVEGLPLGTSECALTVFDDRGLVARDFTRDRAALLAAIDALRPQGGTNYNAALIVPPAGGLTVAAAGINKRVVIFLTDGRGVGSEDAIVDAAAKIDAQVFCVTLGMPAPEIVKNIAHRTGGEVFENVTTVEDAEAIYRAILYRAQGGEPCEISWRSEVGCEVGRSATIALPAHGGSAAVSYLPPSSSTARLDITPTTLDFGAAGGDSRELSVTLAAVNRDVTVSAVTRQGIGSSFSVIDASTPFRIAAGERRTIRVRYEATDTGYAFARWKIVSDACSGGGLFASAGSTARREPSITLLRPNGGERFPAGEETTIAWEGIPIGDTVRLDYSTDAGATWRSITDRATGGTRRWIVPATPSERCLARVSQIDTAAGSRVRGVNLSGHADYILSSDFSPDGRQVVSASWDGTIKVWEPRQGRETRTIVVSTATGGARPQRVYHVEFSPDGRRILGASDGDKTQIWNAADGKLLRAFNGRPFTKTDVARVIVEGDVTPDPVFSADGSRLLLQSDKLPTVWDAVGGAKIAVIRGHRGWVNAAAFSPDGSRVVTAGADSIAGIWDARTGTSVHLLAHGAPVSSALFSPDGAYVATIASGDTVRIWDATTGDPVSGIASGKRHGGTVTRALFSPDGETMLVWAGVDMAPTLYDFRSGRMIRELQEYTPDGRPDARSSVGYAVFSPDGRTVATVAGSIDVWEAGTGRKLESFDWDSQMSHAVFSPDGTRIASSLAARLAIWNVEIPTAQEDRSDALWAIVDSRPVALDVDFGRHMVQTTTDSLVAGMIRNDGASPLRVGAISIQGGAAGDFDLVSGIPPFEIPPKSSRAVELRFRPSTVGLRTAVINIEAGGRTLSRSLRGEGVRPQIRFKTNSIDFGQAPMGSQHDTTIEAIVRNVGSAPITVAGIRVVAPDTIQFEIPGGTNPFTLAPDESRKITLRFSPQRAGRASTRMEILHDGVGGRDFIYLYGEGTGEPVDELYTDPTTFRTFAVPNAILPKKGRIVAGSYDLLGLMAGYGITDNVMVLAGGALPFPDDWGGTRGAMYGAYSLGVKGGIDLGGRWNVALGYQWARSFYDQEATPDQTESAIAVHAPYGALSYGDDDSRLSATVAYAFKRHVTNGIGGTFDRNALVAALGGDYRFANRWKVVLEGFTMQTLGYVPVAATARFFGRNFALDFGLAYLGITTGAEGAPSISIAPLVSYVHVW